MRRFGPAAIAIVALSLIVAGCGEDDNEPSSTTTSAAPSTTAAGGETASTAPAPLTSTSVPPSEETRHLTDVQAVSTPEGDRLTFVFDGAGPPGYSLGYSDGPVGSGEEGQSIQVGGDGVIEARFSMASIVDLTSGVSRTYTGPDRFSPPGLQTVVEIARASDFEAVSTWAIGTKGRPPFEVTTAQGPARIIVTF